MVKNKILFIVFSLLSPVSMTCMAGEPSGSEHFQEQQLDYEYLSNTGIIQQLQERLNSLGYDCGTPDGIVGTKTTAALQRFQKDYGLALSEDIDLEFLAKIGIISNPESSSWQTSSFSSLVEAVDNSTNAISDSLSDNEVVEQLAAYNNILELYKTGSVSRWTKQEFADHGLSYLFGYNPEQVGYMFYDLNQDGITELLLTEIAPSSYEKERFIIYDAYTLADGTPILLFSSEERDRYYYCVDGTIKEEGSGGALLSSHVFYDFPSRSTSLKFREVVGYNGEHNPENPWYHSYDSDYYNNYITISQEEALSLLNKHEIFSDFSLLNITEFSSQSPNKETVSGSMSFNTETNNPSLGSDPHSFYDDIIVEYQTALHGNEALYRETSSDLNTFEEKFPHVGRFVPYAFYEMEEPVSYAYYDVDGNGIDELLIGASYDALYIYDIITTDGKTAICHFDDDWIGQGSNLVVFQNGMIDLEEEHSGSLYRIAENGYDVSLMDVYTKDWFGHPDTPYYYKNEYMTYETFCDRIQAIEIKPEWISF